MSEIYDPHVNGNVHEVGDAWLGESLLYVLRERLGLPGAKTRCEQGECGSCSVLVDGALVCSCLVLAASVVGSEIVDGRGPAARRRGALTDVQQAFVDEGAVQCGFCTPGLVMAVHDLLDRNADPRRPRGPRGDLGQPVPLHGLRARCSAAVRSRDRRPRRRHRDRRRGTRITATGPVIGRRVRTRPDGIPKVQGRVRVLVRPVGRSHAVGADVALAAPVGPHPRHRRQSPRGDPRCRADPHRRPTSPGATYGLEHRGPAGVRGRRRALRRRAGRGGRGRPSRDREARVRRDRRRVRGARTAHRPRARDRGAAAPSRRQRVPASAHRAR